MDIPAKRRGFLPFRRRASSMALACCWTFERAGMAPPFGGAARKARPRRAATYKKGAQRLMEVGLLRKEFTLGLGWLSRTGG